jgi:hypothetical protein
VFHGLSERVQLQVLYGLQCRARAERRTTVAVVQMVVNLLIYPESTVWHRPTVVEARKGLLGH